MSSRATDARERRTIAIAAVVSIVALLLAYVVLPTARRWQAREALIDATRQQVAQLRSLGTYGARLVNDARVQEAAADSLPVRLLRGRSPALVASSLQSLLQDYASASRVSVTRMDVASAGDSAAVEGGGMPASISAVTDIYGLVSFLARVEQGPRMLEIAELAVSENSALRGQLLQLSIVVRAPYLLTP